MLGRAAMVPLVELESLHRATSGKIDMWNALRSSVGDRAPRIDFDELIRHGLAARNDTRRVIADPQARYFGALLGERTLLPGEQARIGETRFEQWLSEQQQVAGAR